MSDYVYGITEAVTFHSGNKVIVHKDEPWDAGDPFVKARPDLFSAQPEKVKETGKPAKRVARRPS